jgi:hypothetical protein
VNHKSGHPRDCNCLARRNFLKMTGAAAAVGNCERGCLRNDWFCAKPCFVESRRGTTNGQLLLNLKERSERLLPRLSARAWSGGKCPEWPVLSGQARLGVGGQCLRGGYSIHHFYPAAFKSIDASNHLQFVLFDRCAENRCGRLRQGQVRRLIDCPCRKPRSRRSPGDHR